MEPHALTAAAPVTSSNILDFFRNALAAVASHVDWKLLAETALTGFVTGGGLGGAIAAVVAHAQAIFLTAQAAHDGVKALTACNTALHTEPPATA